MTPQSRKSVLIIDDETAWLQLYKDILGDEFFLVSASNQEDARQKIAAQNPPFHVVVTDVRLKDWDENNRDGLDLIYELRSKYKYTNAVVITGYDTKDTEFQAKELLQAEYMLKAGYDSDSFDYKLFRKRVHEAAEKAEQQRSVSKIWILEPDYVLREKMSAVLSRQGNNVRSFATPDDLLHEALKGVDKQMHGTLCLNTNLLSEYLDLFEKNRKNMPELKIILMADAQTEAIVRAIRNHSIENAVTLNSDDLNETALDAAVRRSFVSEETKYVTAWIDGAWNNGHLHLQQGHTYTLTLELHRNSRPGALPIWLPPKATKTVLRVVVDAPPCMTLQPEDRIFWEIPPHAALTSDCLLEMTPRAQREVALGEITIFIEHGEFQLGKLQPQRTIRVMIIELLTTTTVSAGVKFLFDQANELLKRLNNEQLETIKSKQASIEKAAQSATTEKEVEDVKKDMKELVAFLPQDIEINTVSSFISWVENHVDNYPDNLIDVCQLTVTVLREVRKKRKKETEENALLVEMESAFKTEIKRFQKSLRLGDRVDERELHRRLIHTLDMLR